MHRSMRKSNWSMRRRKISRLSTPNSRRKRPSPVTASTGRRSCRRVTVTRDRSASGAQVLRIKSTETVTEPFLTLLIEASWARGRLVREYTVLLDPPVFAPNSVARSAAGNACRGWCHHLRPDFPSRSDRNARPRSRWPPVAATATKCSVATASRPLRAVSPRAPVRAPTSSWWLSTAATPAHSKAT